MAQQRLSVPVSLILMVLGLAMVYVVLHGHGWHWNGKVPMIDIWEHLSIPARSMMVVGLILNAWGLGALIDAVMRRKQET